MNGSQAFKWNDAAVSTLKTLWGEGRFAIDIAREIGVGCSRNAVIGKAHRLGLESHQYAKKDGAARRERRPTGIHTASKVRKPRPPAKPKVARLPGRATIAPTVPLPPLREAARTVGQVAFLDLEHHHCRWPLGDEMPFMYCGDPKDGDGPYCAGHRAIAWVPPATRGRKVAAWRTWA